METSVLLALVFLAAVFILGFSSKWMISWSRDSLRQKVVYEWISQMAKNAMTIRYVASLYYHLWSGLIIWLMAYATFFAWWVMAIPGCSNHSTRTLLGDICITPYRNMMWGNPWYHDITPSPKQLSSMSPPSYAKDLLTEYLDICGSKSHLQEHIPRTNGSRIGFPEDELLASLRESRFYVALVQAIGRPLQLNRSRWCS